MSIFSEALQSYKNEVSTIKNPKQWFLNRGRTNSGISVTERSALTLSAYYDGVNLISNHVAYLPFNIMLKDQQTGNRTRKNAHNLRELLQWEANNKMSAFTFKKTMTIHMLNWGNAYAIIHKSRGGQIDEFELIKPWNARIRQDPVTKDIFYDFSGKNRYYMPSEVLHLHQFSLDGIKGLSVVEAGARERLGGHIAAEQYGETFFGNGTHMGGLLTTEDSLGSDPDVVNEAKSEVRGELDNVYGGPKGQHRIGILDGKWEYKNMTLKAADAQLIQRTEATVSDVARWLGVPPAKLKSTQNTAYNTREHEAIDYVQDGLMPRTTIWEQETRRKCFTESEKQQGYETSINVKDLMRGDLNSMAEFLQSMVDRAIFTPNQALEYLGEDTYEGGDVHLMQKNMITLESFLSGASDNQDAANRLAEAIQEITNHKNGHDETYTI